MEETPVNPYPYHDQMKDFLLEEFECIYCGKKTTHSASLGRLECTRHTGRFVRDSARKWLYTWECCGKEERGIGCSMPCDHTDKPFVHDTICVPLHYVEAKLVNPKKENIVKRHYAV